MARTEEEHMEFLVEFDVNVPDGEAPGAVEIRKAAEASAAARLARDGHLLRLWTRSAPSGGSSAVGLYRAESEPELAALLRALPLADWMTITVTPLEAHPNDPPPRATSWARGEPATSGKHLPEPRLTLVYRLEATLGEPLDLGDVGQGHRRIVPQTGGSFRGPELGGELLAGVSADWQIVTEDGTAFADIRSTLRTDGGEMLYVQSRGVRHGSAEVLARLARGEDVDPSDYTFRTSTSIETAAPGLPWLNKGVFVSVGARIPGAVIYDTYLVA
jgi:muconolactone delta-isomerase